MIPTFEVMQDIKRMIQLAVTLSSVVKSQDEEKIQEIINEIKNIQSKYDDK